MAVFKSVIVDSASGSVGNVTLYTLRGQRIARVKNEHPYDPKTPEQLTLRSQFANSVKAYQFLSIYLQDINGLCRTVESNYNCFIRLSKALLPYASGMSPIQLADSLDGNSLGSPNWLLISSTDWTQGLQRVNFNTGLFTFSTGLFCSTMTFNESSGIVRYDSIELTQLDFDNGYVLLPNIPSSLGCSIAYIYSSDHKLCSNICFIQIT